MEVNYSAGMVTHSFWYAEFNIFICLLNEGKTYNEIKQLSKEDNIFIASTEARAKDTYNVLKRRISTLDNELIKLYTTMDIRNKKLINLISIMKVDRLFFEFMLEVTKEKIRIQQLEVSPKDFHVFFNSKKIQNQKIANWKPYTIKRLSSTYLTFLSESGLLREISNNHKLIEIPIVDIHLQEYLETHGDQAIMNVFSGGRNGYTR